MGPSLQDPRAANRCESRDLKSAHPSGRPSLLEPSAISSTVRSTPSLGSAPKACMALGTGRSFTTMADLLSNSICNERGLRALPRLRNPTEVGGSRRRRCSFEGADGHPPPVHRPTLTQLSLRFGIDPDSLPNLRMTRPLSPASHAIRRFHPDHFETGSSWDPLSRVRSHLRRVAPPRASAFPKPAVSCSATFDRLCTPTDRSVQQKSESSNQIFLSTARPSDPTRYPQDAQISGLLSTARPADLATVPDREHSRVIPFRLNKSTTIQLIIQP